MEDKIKLSASKVKRRKKIRKYIKLIILILLLMLLVLYVVISIIYNNGNFSITLDRNLYLQKSIIIYDNPQYKVYRSELYADSLEYFDNISYRWLPDNLDGDNYDGSHNGENYIAYTFYVENIGKDISDYWSEIIIDDSIKNLDDAIRVRVYKNGVATTYAKISSNGTPEKDTVPFKSKTLVSQEHVENFKPGDKDRYTVVVWLEGTDPECTDNILGGEIKMHMEFNSEVTGK